MLIHYLSLAWDQLKKYRLQSAVSIVSLAIGFACFALASMWIKYETTYDAFHKDADRIYYLNQIVSPGTFITDKIEQFPEVEEVARMGMGYHAKINGQDVGADEVVCDSNFISFFGVKILEGDDSFLHNPSMVAITEELAHKLWGDESPIGQALTCEVYNKEDSYKRNRTVGAVLKGWGEHTNFPFEIASVSPKEDGIYSCHFFKFYPNANPDTVNARLDRTPISWINIFGKEDFFSLTHQQLDLVRIDKARQANRYYEQNIAVRLNHIYLFAIAGGVLILCGLLNYLTMFINRLFIRKREIALRTVFGASSRDLMVQFITEYALLLFIAMFFGFMVLDASLNWFRTLAELPHNTGYIYREILLYMSMVIVASILVSLPFIAYFRHQSLQSVVTVVGALNRYNLFRRISTGAQLGIGMCCIFCVVVLMKQLHTLRHGDLGFNRENIGVILMHVNNDEEKTAIFEFIKQQSEVDTLFFTRNPIYPNGSGKGRITPEELPLLTEITDCYEYWVDEAFCNFNGLQLVEGRWMTEKDGVYDILVNETFARLTGWEHPVGENYGRCHVIGVVKDFNNLSPTTPVQPSLFFNSKYYDELHLRNNREGFMLPEELVFRFHPGTWPTLKEKLIKFRQEGSGYIPTIVIYSCMEECEKMLKSENNLKKLLSITTTICILIALFGVLSMIMLTCEQRRKEIAVRKVFGATTKDILDMFFTEYMTLHGIASIVAFPIGYACMKPWLEQYVVQTERSWWIYVGIFLTVALLVALCVGWRVWETAKAKPADEIAKGRG